MKLYLGTRQTKLLFELLLSFFPSRGDALYTLLEQANMGVSIDVSSNTPKHTDEQRGYYWRSLRALGGELGYSAKEAEEYLHREMCCHAYGVAKYLNARMPDGGMSIIAVPKATSSKDETGKTRDRETYSVLIDTLLRISAQNYGVYLPPPTKDVMQKERAA